MLTLTITALSHSGEGIARHEGQVVFVPFALPGEIVRADIIEEKKNYLRAKLLEVVQASPHRVAPPCPYHFTPLALGEGQGGKVACGGCQLQHATYEYQLQLKQQMVIDQFQRIGGITNPPLRPIIASPNPLHYRNHVQFALTPKGQLVFRAAQSSAIIAVTECLVAETAVTQLQKQIHIESLPEMSRLSLRASADDALIVFEAEEDTPDLEIDFPVSAAVLRPDGSTLVLAGNDHFWLTLRGRDFRVSAGAFFQVNTPQAEKLVSLVLEGLALKGGETVFDLYSGVGLFTAFVAPMVAQVICIESFAPAVEDAAVNLDEFDNVQIYVAPAEEVLSSLEVHPDVVILDPPRAGCDPAVLEALIVQRPERIVYVSCDPATLARDAKRLVQAAYKLESVQPLDMFPQTFHVENVAIFTL